MVLTSYLDGKFSPKRDFRPRGNKDFNVLSDGFLKRWERLLPEVTKILTSYLTGFSPEVGAFAPEVTKILTSYLTGISPMGI